LDNRTENLHEAPVSIGGLSNNIDEVEINVVSSSFSIGEGVVTCSPIILSYIEVLKPSPSAEEEYLLDSSGDDVIIASSASLSQIAHELRLFQ
jgi:hypothetical protein